ncbi:MAG: glycosyltransferase family 2 protein [Deltaproteobacteria bacterium]|nr:glycosyltransferase family 2 protein [Deltaproteobacteria bacterium]
MYQTYTTPTLINRHIMKNHISICICTFRRNHTLERLLRKIKLLETGELFDFSVVVVDNDAAGQARETVVRLQEELVLDITYGIESEQTIPAARNHALRLARGDYIGIIDDDELPPQHWLITMYRAIQIFDVDGALGPVHPFFDQHPPIWLLKSQICERPVHRTGTLLRWDQTRTGNVLLKRDVFDKHLLCFDLKCKTSGSDRQFFREAMQLGCRFIAVEEAPVYEIVLPERWTKSYYLKRSLVQGHNSYRYSVKQVRGLSKVIAPIKSMAALLVYTLVLLFCASIGSHLLIKYLEKSAYNLSRLFAMLGIELVKRRDF